MMPPSTPVSLTGFILAKSAVFQIKESPIFLLRLSSRKNCWCTANTHTLLFNMPTALQSHFAQLNVRSWFHFTHLQPNTLTTTGANPRDILLFTDESRLNEVAVSGDINDGACSCHGGRGHLVNYTGVVSSCMAGTGLLLDSDRMKLLTVGGIQPTTGIPLTPGDTLNCFNVWLLKGEEGVAKGPTGVLVANSLTSYTAISSECSEAKNLLTESARQLHRTVHSRSLTPHQVASLCAAYERGGCFFPTAHLAKALDLVYGRLLPQNPRQFILDFIDLSPATSAMGRSAPVVLYPSELSSLGQPGDGEENEIEKVVRDDRTGWQVTLSSEKPSGTSLIGWLRLDRVTFTTAVMDDAGGRVVCGALQCENEEWSARLDALVAIDNLRFVEESFTSQSVPPSPPLAYLTGVLVVTDTATHSATSGLHFCINSISGIRHTSTSDYVFTCHITPQAPATTPLSIDVCGLEAVGIFFPLLNQPSQLPWYRLCGLSANQSSGDKISITSCRNLSLHHSSQESTAGDKILTSVQVAIEMAAAAGIRDTRPINIYGRIRGKWSPYHLQLEDPNTSDTVKIILPARVGSHLGLMPGQHITVYDVSRLRGSIKGGSGPVGYIGSPGGCRVAVLHRSYTGPPAVPPAHIHMSRLTALGKPTVHLTSRAHVVRVFHLTVQPHSASVLIDDGSALATVFLNQAQHIRTLLALTNIQWERVLDILPDYRYPAGSWFDQWLTSSLVLRPLLFTLRFEKRPNTKAAGYSSKSEMPNFDLKRINVSGKEFEVLTKAFLRCFCLNVTPEFRPTNALS